MDLENLFERRSGADRRRGVERRNGMSVLMAGCSLCDRIAPSPADMHAEGWEIEYDETGLVSITCPKHKQESGSADASQLPDYLLID